MAGAFCIVAAEDLTGGSVIARRLAAAMELFPWQRSRVLEPVPGRIWLGAVTNGADAGALDHACHCAGPVAAVVEGCFLRARTECGAEPLIAQGRYAEAAIAAYGCHGADFAAALEGQFNAIIYDAGARTALIGNGRHEGSPLYWSDQGLAFGAATSLGPLGACGLFAPAVDPQSTATFLAYGQLFADQSLLSGVHVMPQASVLEAAADGRRVRSTRYWDMGRIEPAAESLTLRQHVSELADTARAAGRLATRRPGRYVAGLSGGMDSRLNLAAVAPHLPGLQAWTFGAPGATDLQMASAICKSLGLPHLTYAIEPSAIPRNIADFVATVDGCMSASFAYQLDRARDLRERADVVLNGYAGEVIVRGIMLDLKEKDWLRWAKGRIGLGPRSPHPRFERNRSPESALGYVQRKYGRLSGLACLTQPEAPPFVELAGADMARLRDSVPAHLVGEAWILENRGRRWTIMGVVSDRHFYADGSIFYDYDLQDRCFATPLRFRRGARLYRPLLAALDRRLVAMPYGNTGLPLGAPRAEVVAAGLAARAGLRPRPPRASTGASPADWARREIRDVWQALIDAASTRGRPWWDGEAVARCWQAHLDGKSDFSAELGLIASVELFSRRFVDGCRPAGADSRAPNSADS